ncbi:PucR family transcriptional regulator [Catenulispora pinisilvae]|uniref:PucR family transcriptional regulator n=1 Tax=Catenulispora pinisilvae TaxID=2705253 RepID=UPI001891CDBB|nr:helix-turn-helix domain-containing protein [Catenulispora pinisilvae]
MSLANPSVIRQRDDGAALLRVRVDTLAAAMVRAYQAEISEYREINDDLLLGDVLEVSVATVRCCLNAIRTGQLHDEDFVPLIEGARRRAVQGFGKEAVLRAYRLGVQVFWREVTEALADTGTASEHDLVSMAAASVLEFADRISTEVAAAYAGQAGRDGRVMEQQYRSQLFESVLAGTLAEHHRGVDTFAVRHCVVVAEVRSSAPFADLEEVGRSIVNRAGALSWTVRHRSVVAALELPDRGRDKLVRSLAALPSDQVVGIGLGYVAENASQTRQSYVEALDALRVGLGITGQTAIRPVFDHYSMAPLIAMLAEPDRARRFVAAALAPLSSVMDRGWALPTVDAYLTHGGCLNDVALALNVHKSTVKYRLSELRPYLDLAACGGEQSATLLLAVRVHKYLSTAGFDLR